MAKTAKRSKGTLADPSPSGARRFQICLTGNDYAAIEFLGKKYKIERMTDVIRYALERQVERDLTLPKLKAIRIQDKQKELAALKKERPGLEAAKALAEKKPTKKASATVAALSVRQWSCWLQPDDMTRSNAVSSRHGFTAVATAIRFSLRVQAEIDGMIPPGGW